MGTTPLGIAFPDPASTPARQQLEDLATTADAAITVLSSAYAWVTYSPALTNISVGNGTLVGRYRKIGPTVDVYIQLTFGSTTAISAAALVQLPVAAAQTGWAASGSALDLSASAYFGLSPVATGSTNLALRTLPTTAGSNLVVVNSSLPFTWATGDVLTINATYETPS